MSDDGRAGTPKDTHYAKLRRAHRERNAAPQTRGGKRPGHRSAPDEAPRDGLVRLYGLHTVRAALDNPARTIRRLLVTRNAAERLALPDLGALAFPVEMAEPRDIDRITGADAVHQGVLAEAEPLRPKRLDALSDGRLVVVLDQVTDPHNVGAIMRSAVAFGVSALVTTVRHSPAESGVLAKAASGALEHIDHVEVRNLAEAIQTLREQGFQTIGLDSEGPEPLEVCFAGRRLAIVLGAEGKGLRQKTRTTVDVLARLDVPGAIASLNVSNAAAVSLYAARRFLATLQPPSRCTRPGGFLPRFSRRCPAGR